MTTQEKQKIAELRAAGLGHKKIATQIGISENTVKSYLKRMTAADDQKEPDQPAAVFSCLQCGEEIQQQIPGRKKGILLRFLFFTFITLYHQQNPISTFFSPSGKTLSLAT